MKNRTFRLIAALVILGLAVVILYWTMAPRTITYSNPAYYLDSGTGKIYIASLGQPASLRGPSGSEGFRVTAYSCGDCGDATQLKPGAVSKYIERPAGEPSISKSGAPTPPPPSDAHVIQQLVASPDHLDQWVDILSPDGQRVISEAVPKCTGGARPKNCSPSSK